MLYLVTLITHAIDQTGIRHPLPSQACRQVFGRIQSKACSLKKVPVFSLSGHTGTVLDGTFPKQLRTAGMSSLVLEAGPGSASCRWPATKRGITDFWNLLLVSQGSAPFLGQIKTTQSRLNCLDFWICFCLFFFHFLLQSN